MAPFAAYGLVRLRSLPLAAYSVIAIATVIAVQSNWRYQGSTDWGDQTAMNLYCHSNPASWLAIPVGWNTFPADLRPSNGWVSLDERHERLDGEPIHVVHGIGSALRRWDLFHLTA